MAMNTRELVTLLGSLSPEEKEQVSAALGEENKDAKPAAIAGHGQTPPRISQFSGDAGKDVSYAQWQFEVRGLQRDGNYSEALMLQAVRRSLRGTATEVLLHLGEDVKLNNVVSKFNLVFGNILPADTILEQFYTARQRDTETAATWACRLEDLMAQLRVKDAMVTAGDTAKSMLHSKFYSGLRSGILRNALRHKYDAGDSFEDLLMAARVAELEEQSEKKTTAKVHQATAVDSDMTKKLDQVLAGPDEVRKRLDKLEQDKKTSPSGPSQGESGGQNQQKPNTFRGKCYKCGEPGHPKWRCPLNQQQPASGVSGSAAETTDPSQR